MGAVTFPNPEVSEYIVKNLIPLRLPHNHKPLADQFQVKWTPTLVTLDQEGREHHRSVGFLGPEEVIPSLMLGRAKIHFDLDQIEDALKILESIVKKYPKSDVTAEAVFLLGVCRYKSTHDPKPLKEAYERLSSEYPQSEWAKRAYPYRLL